MIGRFKPLAACVEGGLAVRVHQPLHLFGQRGQRFLAVGGDGEVHRLEALELLVIGIAPKIAGGDGDNARAGLGDGAGTAHDAVAEHMGGAVEVVHLQAQNDIGLAQNGVAAASVIERMPGREIGTPALVDHWALQGLGQFDQPVHAVLCPRKTVGNDHGIFRLDQKVRGFRHGTAVALRQRHTRQRRHGERGAVRDRIFLHLAVERQQYRPHRRRHGDLPGAHGRFREMLQRGGLVVPFQIVACNNRGIDGGMVPFEGEQPLGGVQRIANDHVDGRLVAIGVVQRHGGVLQADRGLRHHRHRLALDLHIAMRHGHGDFLVGATEQFRRLVAAMIDDRLMKAAEGVGRCLGHIFDLQHLQDIDHEVAAAGGLLDRIGRRRQGLRGHVGRRHRTACGRGDGRLGGGGPGRSQRRAGQRSALQKAAAADGFAIILRHVIPFNPLVGA